LGGNGARAAPIILYHQCAVASNLDCVGTRGGFTQSASTPGSSSSDNEPPAQGATDLSLQINLALLALMLGD
jgi:hypothetical protein